MNRTSRFAATAFAAILAGTPVAVLAQSSSTGAPSTTGAGSSSSSASNENAGTNTGANGAGQHLSQSDLRDVQQQLQQQGYYKNAQVDRKVGPETRQAVMSFQQSKGMQATGQLDQQTLSALGVNNTRGG